MAVESPDTTYDPGRPAAWAEFHAAVAALDDADCELFDLLWYQGLTQSEPPPSWASASGPSTAAGWRRGSD
jgi:hypothetical protein